MASTLKEQSKDLSTCCVCMEMFENEGQLKPKSLACLHTYCLGCLKVSSVPVQSHKTAVFKVIHFRIWHTLIQLPAKTVNCPVCKVVHTIPGGVDSLPTNTFALHIVHLNKSISNGFFVERLTSGTGLYSGKLYRFKSSCIKQIILSYFTAVKKYKFGLSFYRKHLDSEIIWRNTSPTDSDRNQFFQFFGLKFIEPCLLGDFSREF